MPLVSVVIPAYNPRDLLRRSLESVLSQTVHDVECIVVDDGSPEDISWVERVPDPRVVLVRQPNRGVSVARNVGSLRARSEFLAFLDQDDEWLPQKLERQLESAEAVDASFSYTAFDWVLPSRTVDGTYRVPVTYHGLLRDQHVCLSSLLVRRDAYWAVGGHDPLLSQMQDYDLFLRLSMAGGNPVLTNERLVRYHVHGGNASLDYRSAARERSRILDAHAARALRTGDTAAWKAAREGNRTTRDLYSRQAVDQVRTSARTRDIRGALRHLGWAARLRPSVVAESAATAGKAFVRRFPPRA